MSLFKKTIDPSKSWEPVLRKYGHLPSISLENLSFSSLIMPNGFPSELVLKNQHSKVCIYDSSFDIKVGDSSIEYLNNEIYVHTAINKDQFTYLCSAIFGVSKNSVKFLTPMLSDEIIKNTLSSEKIVLQHCNLWIESS